VLQVAAATVRLLGRAEVGGTPVEMPGVGSEYYEMRGYQPGDDYRSVNWKATARLGELMVMEHMKEVGGAHLLVLDVRSRGFRDADELASTFLAFANSLGGAGASFGILVHDGESVLELSWGQDPAASMTVALKAAVRATRLDAKPEFLELVPARVAKALVAPKAVFEGETVLSAMAGLRKEEMSSMLEESSPWAAASRLVRETQTKSVLYVSGLLGDVRPVIELAWESSHYRDVEFAVANPCDKGSDRSRYLRQAKALNEVGARYHRGEPADLLRRILGA